ncbi:MAG: Uma2 family endonuclease [Oscillospiraceae bacterium]|nr:Uma2 family endonuclease [Oscillospiraceae bacterium]
MTQDLIYKAIKRKKYNAKQFLELTKNTTDRYELIGGNIFLMASPSVSHQSITINIATALNIYLKGKQCRPFIAPLDVVLFEKNKKNEAKNVFQPDVFVVCDPKKINKTKINGAPDLVFEIVSPSNPETDYIDKLHIYMKYGVHEYWIINPETRNVLVYTKNKKELKNYAYTFEDTIKVHIFEDFEIDFKEFL